MVSALLGYGITAEEAKKIADGIRLEPASQENASITFSYAEALTYNEDGEPETDIPSDTAYYIPSSYYKIGDSLPAPLTFDPGLAMTVEQVEVYDSIRDFDRSYFYEGTYKDRLAHYADTDGTLLSYDRKYYTEADGILTLPKLEQTRLTSRRFVCLTIQVASSRKRDILKFSTYYDIEFYKENTDGTLVFDEEYVNEESFGKPIYFDTSLTDHNDPDFFFTKIPAGQTVTFHIGYFVDEDHLDEMFLRTDGGSSEIYYLTDIRQKK